jgi:hypothetical protein
MSPRTPPTENSERTAPFRSASSLSGPAGKAATIPPKVSHSDDAVELKNMEASRDDAKDSVPIEEDIMQLARLGEVVAVKKLFDSRKFVANYRDEEGITPLHVRHLPPHSLELASTLYSEWRPDNHASLENSGLQSTINMPCASSYWILVPM